MPRLEVHTHDRRLVYQILDPEFVIGSGEAAELRLRGEHVRDAQVRCRLLESGLFVEPGQGVPRLLVNGRATQGATLTHGDTLCVGTHLLVFCVDDLPAPIVKPSMIPDDEAAALAMAADVSKADGLALDIRLPGSERAAKVPSKVRRAGVDPLATPGKKTASEEPKAPARPVIKAPVSRAAGAPGRAATRSRAPSSGRGGASHRASSANGKWIIWSVVVVGAALVLILAQAFGGGSNPENDESLVELAERQWQSGDHDAAFRTLAMAEDSSRGAERDRIRTLRDGWKAAMSREADRAMIEEAQQAHRLATRFRTSFFDQADPKRPAARELLRQCRIWIDDYQSLAERYQDVRKWLTDVQDLRDLALRHTSVDDVDNADDVLYRVDYWLRFTNRRYRASLDALEAWLRTNNDDEAGARRVRRKREELLRDGPAWLVERRQEILRHHQDNQLGTAISALRFLVEGGVPTDWLTDEAQLLDRYESEAVGR